MARNTWVSLYNEDPRGLSADGLSLASFTTSAPVFPTFAFPANYFKSNRLIGLRARGIYGTSTSAPTMTWRLQNTVGTTVTIVTSAAITMPTGTITNGAWVLDLEIQCRTEGTSGTLEAMGDLSISTSGTASQTVYLPAHATAPATATVDTTIAQTWGLEVACSVSGAANTVAGRVLRVLSLS